MSFLKNLLRKKIKPCPPHNQEQIDGMGKTIEDTNTKLDWLEDLINKDAFNRLMIIPKEKEKKDGLDITSVRRSCGC
jgi:hypothetical protein